MMVYYCGYEETVLIFRKCLNYLLRDKFYGVCDLCSNGSLRGEKTYVNNS